MNFAIQQPLFIRSMNPFKTIKDLFLKTEDSDDKPKGEDIPGWAKKLQETLESLVPKETQTEDKPLEVPTPPPPATVEEEEDPQPVANPVKKFLDWLM
jgi:hypothetical protein